MVGSWKEDREKQRNEKYLIQKETNRQINTDTDIQTETEN